MAPPPDRTFEGGRQHPTGCLLVCQGHHTQFQTDAGGPLQITILTMNIWAFKDRSDNDKIYFCIELYTNGQHGEHQWLAEEDYLQAHNGLWLGFDMDANFDFDEGGGLRNPDGVVMNGTNKLVERGGALKMAAIRENCP